MSDPTPPQGPISNFSPMPNQPQPANSGQAFRTFMTRRVAMPMWAILVASCVVCAAVSAAASTGNGKSSTNTASTAPTATATATRGPTATTGPTATPTKPPTPTRAPQWTTVKSFSGSANQQTDTFHIDDGSHIVWSYQINDSANFFAITLYSSDGSYVDQLANYANVSQGQQSVYTVHGGGDFYLKIEADSVNWTINVQVYK